MLQQTLIHVGLEPATLEPCCKSSSLNTGGCYAASLSDSPLRCFPNDKM
uniref:Uncharacterized protein n=1 Tax=Anguilla anguilla TaxID=7936 RepID=A0A0E9VTF4_ANGAN